jgi:hypothetical protein
MTVARLAVVCLSCLSLGGCLTAYRGPPEGPSAQLTFSSPTYSTSLLSSAKLSVAIDRVGKDCKVTQLGWLDYDAKTKDEVHRLTAGAIAALSIHYNRTTLFAGNLNGGMDIVFIPQENRKYTLEFVTDDKTFDAKVYDVTNGTRAEVRSGESIFNFCLPTA